jgi:hypothetical protein
LRVTGKVAPDTVNPAPATVAELTVTAEVPLEVKVTGSVAGEPMNTQPNATLAVLALSDGEVAENAARGEMEAKIRKRAVRQCLKVRTGDRW